MRLFYNASIVYFLEILFLLSCVLNSISGRRIQYPEEDYFRGGYYGREQQDNENKIKIALEKLEHAPQWVQDWPDPTIKMGQVSGVALDNAGRVLVFHRASNVWDATTFTDRDVYRNIGTPPIPHATILAFNDSGSLVDMWGQNLFYIPHGITVDKEGNVWITDVAMHQVFKFTPDNRQKPALVLGEKFVPRNDETHFCKPSAVAVLSTGDFFVADGYCNTRIIKFAPDGTRILQWGRRKGESPFVFTVPHALTLAEDKGQVCVANRERGCVACFRTDNGTFVQQYHSWLIGPRIFSVAYSPVRGGRLYIVNGPMPEQEVPVRGYVVDFRSGRLIQTFAPDQGFANPHDVVASADGSKVYVAELNPYRAYKFIDETLKNYSRNEDQNVSVPVKPTATVGRKGMTRRRWEYGHGEFKLRRLLERRRFTRVHSDDSDEEPSPMLPPPQPPANA
ncbi:peptidyl-alpha-hydroxyglycine alpha-amidating lyase 1-like isoform X2 [Hyposmocoma kahamanoa]|uniref:peptidyl-alpha-hydroxyglycine alpha-amidating lyase 1-like isoform X2 n=1 Tax=Hyposmocoma kahamanoa TaxID=1477025 RepID=UPI000E6D6700|nr:peptidyl-alpha-hydroxyglycine alpha-amidating lyase 1-like isoform X2 [Hyposmocoma kahamanoa]